MIERKNMNLVIISLAIMGAIAVAFSIANELLCVHNNPLWARALAIILMLGGYLGVVALIMLLCGMPLS